jgi:hypothetical protein
MKYWGYLVSKLAAAGGILYALGWIIGRLLPAPPAYIDGGPFPAEHSSIMTLVLLVYCLFAAGLIWVIVWDQRMRCRACLRRLRMPIHRGSWTHVLFGAPRTEYICPYGHGTLNIAELQITGHQQPDWQPHEDMWKELLSLEETKK